MGQERGGGLPEVADEGEHVGQPLAHVRLEQRDQLSDLLHQELRQRLVRAAQHAQQHRHDLCARACTPLRQHEQGRELLYARGGVQACTKHTTLQHALNSQFR